MEGEGILGRGSPPGQRCGGLKYLTQTWLRWAQGVKTFEGPTKEFELDPSVVNREP